MPRKASAAEETTEEAAPEQDFSPVHQQGATAKEIGLTRADCPYAADGPNRAAWLAGFDGE